VVVVVVVVLVVVLVVAVVLVLVLVLVVVLVVPTTPPCYHPYPLSPLLPPPFSLSDPALKVFQRNTRSKAKVDDDSGHKGNGSNGIYKRRRGQSEW